MRAISQFYTKRHRKHSKYMQQNICFQRGDSMANGKSFPKTAWKVAWIQRFGTPEIWNSDHPNPPIFYTENMLILSETSMQFHFPRKWHTRNCIIPAGKAAGDDTCAAERTTAAGNDVRKQLYSCMNLAANHSWSTRTKILPSRTIRFPARIQLLFHTWAADWISACEISCKKH